MIFRNKQDYGTEDRSVLARSWGGGVDKEAWRNLGCDGAVHTMISVGGDITLCLLKMYRTIP